MTDLFNFDLSQELTDLYKSGWIAGAAAATQIITDTLEECKNHPGFATIDFKALGDRVLKNIDKIG